MEGLENKESTVDDLLNKIEIGNQKNLSRAKKIIEDLNSTLRDYKSIKERLKTTTANTDQMEAIDKHSSVQPLPSSDKLPVLTPPTGPCPNKNGKIIWPGTKEGFDSKATESKATESKATKEAGMEKADQLQETLWHSRLDKQSAKYINIEYQLIDAVFIVTFIEEIGNDIQNTLQQNKF